MRIFTLAGSKGGSGKSVSLIALASAAIANGENVLAIDTDQVVGDHSGGTLANWYNVSKELDFSHDNLAVETAINVPDIIKVMEKYEGWADICLVDTRGGFDEAIVPMASISDLIIIPSMPDLDELRRAKIIDAVLNEVETEDTNNEYNIAPRISIFNRTVPLSKRKSEEEARENADEIGIKFASTELRDRKAYKSMRDSGLLSPIIQFLETQGPMEKGQARHYKEALTECIALLAELDEFAGVTA